MAAGLGGTVRWLIGAEVREECAVGTGEGASPKENRADGASGLKQTPLRIQELRAAFLQGRSS